MLKKAIGIAIFLLISISSVSNAQGKLGFIGKIFTKKEAKVLFGDVKSSVVLKKSALIKAIGQANDYVAFFVKNGKISLINEKRSLLAGDSQKIEKGDPIFIFSKTILAEFLAKTVDSDIMVEERSSTSTLSVEDVTLEYTMRCPPICWE